MAGSDVTIKRLRTQDVAAQRYFKRYRLEINWTADDSDGSVPNTALPAISGRLIIAVTDPGATAPTAAYDIVLEDEYGFDVMGGTLADRSATVTEQAFPSDGSNNIERIVDGVLTFKLTNNSVNSAVGQCILYIEP